MANTFDQQVEYLSHLDHQKKSNFNLSSARNSNALSSATSYQPNYGANFNNSTQPSPITTVFSNCNVSNPDITSSTSSFLPKNSLDSFNLGFEDWICWDNNSSRALSESPTKTINTTIATPPDIYLKYKNSLSPIQGSIGLKNQKYHNCGENVCIVGDVFMENSICYDGREVIFQDSLQKTAQCFLRPKSLAKNYKVDHSFAISCSPESCLNSVNADKSRKAESDDKLNKSSAVADKRVEGNSMISNPSFVPQRDQLGCPRITTHAGEQNNKVEPGIEQTKIDYHLAEHYEIESTESGEVSLSSTPPHLFQSYSGQALQKSGPVRSIPRKRKTRSEFQDKKQGSPVAESTVKNLYSNGNFNRVEESQANGIVHTIGRTKTPKKTAHNMIEKRYRTNLNDKIAALRDAVPSLRAAVKNDMGFFHEASSNSNVSKINDQEDDSYCGNSRVGNSETEIEDLQGLTVAHKLNKATILTKAAEYIAHLEKRNRTLLSENSALETRINAFEMLDLSMKCDQGIWIEKLIES